MAKQKKIMDIHEGRTHLVVIRDNVARHNPYRIYLIISPTGAPVRKRQLIQYADFMSVLYFLRDFFLYGLDAMCYSEMREWIKQRTI